MDIRLTDVKIFISIFDHILITFSKWNADSNYSFEVCVHFLLWMAFLTDECNKTCFREVVSSYYPFKLRWWLSLVSHVQNVMAMIKSGKTFEVISDAQLCSFYFRKLFLLLTMNGDFCFYNVVNSNSNSH